MCIRDRNWNDGKQFRMKAKEGHVYTNDPFPLFEVNTDENELNKCPEGQEPDENGVCRDIPPPPPNPFENVNIDLVNEVTAGNAELPVITTERISKSKKKVAEKLNETLGAYGFFVETGGANEIIISHVGSDMIGTFKVGGKEFGLGNETKKARQVEGINEFINRVSQIQVNWDEYNKTYGLETQE